MTGALITYMAGIKADMPDLIDSGGAQEVSIGYFKDQVIPLVIGVAIMGLSLMLGLGLLETFKQPLMNVPVVGNLMSSGQGSDAPSGWEGL